MTKKLSFEAKEKMVQLAAACFWYWDGLHNFLKSCGIPETLYMKYPRDAYNKYTFMRAVLDELDRDGREEQINEIVSGFYRLSGARDTEQLDAKKAKRLLTEFRGIVGNDPIESEIKKREQKQVRASYEQHIGAIQTRNLRIEKINGAFQDLTNATNVTPQQRGFKLERLFFDLVDVSELQHTLPFRNPGNEQIDGHFIYEKFHYLVETKWEQASTKQPDLSIFDGKIRGKAQSTRGFFLSASGFDEFAVQKYQGDSPRIILMTGEDLALILGGRMSFTDALQAKVDAIVRLGKILLPVREIIV
jgi:hypothetical protein